MIEEIRNEGELLAVIIRGNFNNHGVSFVTPDDLTLQLAHMRHPIGKQIRPHRHNPVKREVLHTHEVLFIKRGRLRVDLYDNEQQYLHSRILEAGDVILLAGGGHGFAVLDEVEMIEVKQGPYVGEMDKTRFDADPNLKPRILQ